jgi:ketosteroid isomerase-like protein
MKRFTFVRATSLFLLTACAPSVDTGLVPSRAAVLENQMMQADRDFATATHARGIDGWMSFYAPDAIRIVYRGGIVKGLEAIRKLDTPFISDPASTLNWEPLEAHVYSDGNHGITIGRYSVIGKSAAFAGKEIGRGRYVTTWRRENGKWLVIMDTGYPEPPASP